MPLPVSVIPYVATAFEGNDEGIADPPTSNFLKTLVSKRSRTVGTTETSEAPSRPVCSQREASKYSCVRSSVPVWIAREITEKPPI